MAQKKSRKTSKFLVGAGVAAAVAGGVVAFLTQTKRGKALATKGKKQATEVAKKVAVEAGKVKKLSQAKYEELIDEILAEYTRKKNITKSAADELAQELKKEWNQVRKEFRK